MTRQEAMQAAETYSDTNQQSIMVVKWAGEYALAHTLPTHATAVGRYYPANYTMPGWVKCSGWDEVEEGEQRG